MTVCGSEEQRAVLHQSLSRSPVFHPYKKPPEGAQTHTQGAASRLPVFGSEEPNQVSVLDKSPLCRKHER